MSVVSGDDVRTNYIRINREVDQGCILSSFLFNAFFEVIFQEATQTIEVDTKFNGQFIAYIRYVDDTTNLADNMQDLQTIVQTSV